MYWDGKTCKLWIASRSFSRCSLLTEDEKEDVGSIPFASRIPSLTSGFSSSKCETWLRRNGNFLNEPIKIYCFLTLESDFKFGGLKQVTWMDAKFLLRDKGSRSKREQPSCTSMDTDSPAKFIYIYNKIYITQIIALKHIKTAYLGIKLL